MTNARVRRERGGARVRLRIPDESYTLPVVRLWHTMIILAGDVAWLIWRPPRQWLHSPAIGAVFEAIADIEVRHHGGAVVGIAEIHFVIAHQPSRAARRIA